MDPSNITDDPFIREIEQGVQWRRRDPESGKAYMDWMYEKSRAIRDTRVQDMQNMYQILMDMGDDHAGAVNRIAKQFKIEPEDIEGMLAEEITEESK